MDPPPDAATADADAPPPPERPAEAQEGNSRPAAGPDPSANSGGLRGTPVGPPNPHAGPPPRASAPSPDAAHPPGGTPPPPDGPAATALPADTALAAVRRRFDAALARLVASLRQDPYVLAAVLFGSMAHDVVWEKSDIDLLLVVQEGAKRRADGVNLVEEGVNIHAAAVPRSEFRRMIEGSLQSSFLASAISRGRLLFTRDPSIEGMMADLGGLGRADRDAALLGAAAAVLGAVAKAHKWYRTRGDMRYAFFWIMKAVDGLADIETIAHGDVPGREVVQQALAINPAFFGAIYTDLIDGPKTPATVGSALALIEAYLRQHAPTVFRPILDHLALAGGPRSCSDLDHHFARQMNVEGLAPAYEWLADEGIIAKVSCPVRLSERSRVDLQEAAYHYGGPPGGG